MANEIYENNSGKKLDRYGVWIKKTPGTKKIESDNFVSEINEYEEDFLIEEVPIVSFDEKPMKINVPEEHINLDENNDVILEENYDDSTGFAPIGDMNFEQTKNKIQETNVGNEETDMSLNSADIEDIDLDDFLSDSPVTEEYKAPEVAEVKTEKDSTADFETVDLGDFGIEEHSEPDSVSKAPVTGEHIDLDIHFADAEEKAKSVSDKNSSSAFDDLLDELTGSDGDMVEVSLDDFMGDIEAPRKEEVEEVQEIPEPKTTVEEFSLASIKSAKSSNNHSDTPNPKEQKSETAGGGFEEISLDDFFADETIVDVATGATIVNEVPTTSKSEVVKSLELNIDEDFDDGGVQDIAGGLSYNEVENLDLFGNEIKTEIVETKSETKKDADTSDTKEQLFEEKQNSTNKKVTEFKPVEVSEKTTPLSDLTAIVKDEKTPSFVPESPDFDIEDEAEPPAFYNEKQAEENSEEVFFDAEPITENPAFDDVSALTNDLLSDVKHINKTNSESEKMQANEETNKLLMQLVEQMASMKAEVESLKDELVSVKKAKILTPESAINTVDFKSDTKAENIVESLGLEVEKTSSGFFDDDGSDETISLTGDELDNLISTADFANDHYGTKDENLEVPEVLDMSKTFNDYSDSGTSETDEEFVASDGTEIEVPEMSFDVNSDDAVQEKTEAELELLEINFDDETNEQNLTTDETGETETSSDTDTDINVEIPEISFEDEADGTEHETDGAIETELIEDEIPEAEANSETDIDLEIPEISFEDETDSTEHETDGAIETELIEDEIPEAEANSETDIDLEIPEINFDDASSDSPISAIIDDDEPVDLVLDESELSAAENLVVDNGENISEQAIEVEHFTEVDNAELVEDEKTEGESEIVSDAEEFIELDNDEMLPSELLAKDEDAVELTHAVVDEAENFNTDDLDEIVEDIPMVDLDVQSLDKETATDLQEQISTVKQEINQQKETETIPIDMKEEIKSVLTYMDQLLESLPEEKIEEFAKSEYFETYKKLFEDLGIS